MDRWTLEEIQDILSQIDELRQRLDRLLNQNELSGLTEPLGGILKEIDEQAQQQAAKEFSAALVRVNLEDRDYRLIRIIDGDTLEVRPPEELMRWMRDVHIRLYGIDAPESNTELGPIYTDILERLCQLNDGRLHVIWERERRGSEYGGYPTTSFERGIGNLFVDIGDGFFLYVNAVLASLPDVQIERQNKMLIRAARHLRVGPSMGKNWYRHLHPCFRWSSSPLTARQILDFLSSTESPVLREWFCFNQIYHGFLSALPKHIVLRTANYPAATCKMLAEWTKACQCPLCSKMTHEIMTLWPGLLESENATPFDMLLLLTYYWSHKSEPIAEE